MVRCDGPNGVRIRIRGGVVMLGRSVPEFLFEAFEVDPMAPERCYQYCHPGGLIGGRSSVCHVRHSQVVVSIRVEGNSRTTAERLVCASVLHSMS